MTFHARCAFCSLERGRPARRHVEAVGQGKQYPYLFWEADVVGKALFQMDEGTCFCFKRETVVADLDTVLTQLVAISEGEPNPQM